MHDSGPNFRHREAPSPVVVRFTAAHSKAHLDEPRYRQNPPESGEQIGGLLLKAQEEERSRIARELHDDIAQEIALLNIRTERLRGSRKVEDPISPELERLSAGLHSLSRKIRDLSHQLHSPELSMLGLETGLRSFCREFTQAHGIPVYFLCERVPDHLDSAVALAFFRVAQEALQNIAKHSNASNATVLLVGSSGELCLQVLDSGKGFDPARMQDKAGIGLSSMRERMKLVGGQLSMYSTPGVGTRVEARLKTAA